MLLKLLYVPPICTAFTVDPQNAAETEAAAQRHMSDLATQQAAADARAVELQAQQARVDARAAAVEIAQAQCAEQHRQVSRVFTAAGVQLRPVSALGRAMVGTYTVLNPATGFVLQ